MGGNILSLGPHGAPYGAHGAPWGTHGAHGPPNCKFSFPPGPGAPWAPPGLHGPPGRWALGPMGSGAHGPWGPRAPGAHGAPGRAHGAPGPGGKENLQFGGPWAPWVPHGAPWAPYGAPWDPKFGIFLPWSGGAGHSIIRPHIIFGIIQCFFLGFLHNFLISGWKPSVFIWVFY